MSKTPARIRRGSPLLGADTDELLRGAGSAAFITFNRPVSRNAMTWDMCEALHDACETVDADPTVRTAVIRGAGEKAFVAGTDIHQSLDLKDSVDGLTYERRPGGVIDRREAVRVPTIVVIDGYAVGGGIILATACDIRIASPAACFGLPIARALGNYLSAANYARLVALAGPARTLELVFTAELIDAARLAQMGLLNGVVDPEGLDVRILEFCPRLDAHVPMTMWARSPCEDSAARDEPIPATWWSAPTTAVRTSRRATALSSPRGQPCVKEDRRVVGFLRSGWCASCCFSTTSLLICVVTVARAAHAPRLPPEEQDSVPECACRYQCRYMPLRSVTRARLLRSGKFDAIQSAAVVHEHRRGGRRGARPSQGMTEQGTVVDPGVGRIDLRAKPNVVVTRSVHRTQSIQGRK